jgi:hypothetical protein
VTFDLTPTSAQLDLSMRHRVPEPIMQLAMKVLRPPRK